MEIEYELQTDDKIEKLIVEAFEKLNVDKFGVTDAFDRAVFFLAVCGILIEKRYEYAKKVAIAKADMKSEWSKAVKRVEEKAISAKKELAFMDESYVDKVIAYGNVESSYRRLDSLIDVFSDAHITFRSISKEQ